MSKFYIIKCCQAFLAFEYLLKAIVYMLNKHCLFLLLWLKTLKITLFFMPINQDQFWGSNVKVCVTYPINANVAIIISDSQQKYLCLIHLLVQKQNWLRLCKFIR